MTNADKAALWNQLGKFQKDEWDILDDDEFAAISGAVIVIVENMKKDGDNQW